MKEVKLMPEKTLDFKDSVYFFALRVLGGIFSVHLLTNLFIFFTYELEALFGGFIVNFVITGIGIMLLITFAYSIGWRQGNRDLSLESRGILKYDNKKGLLAGVFGLIPFILLSVIYTALFYLTDISPWKWLFQLLNPEFVLFFDLPYIFIIVYAVLIFVVWFGYIYGYKNNSFSKRLMYKEDN